MSEKRSLKPHLIASLAAGSACAWLLPFEWFKSIATVALGTIFLSAVFASVGSEDRKPLSDPAKVLAWLVLGTSQPNAAVGPRGQWALRIFLMSAVFFSGFAIGICVLAGV